MAITSDRGRTQATVAQRTLDIALWLSIPIVLLQVLVNDWLSLYNIGEDLNR